MKWRTNLRTLLAEGTYRTQSDLVGALQRAGVAVDQSSVSRELRSLGVRKRAGVYRLPEPGVDLGAPIRGLTVTAGGCLCVLRTDPAFAPVVATAIDERQERGILGTIAGDDTVFVALDGQRGLDSLKQIVGPLAPETP